MNEGVTYKEAAEHFGVSQTTVRYYLVKYGIESKNKRKSSPIYKLGESELKELVSSSFSISEILRKVGVHANATHNRTILKSKLAEFNIDYSDITKGKGHHRRGTKGHSPRVDREEFLSRLELRKEYHSNWKKFIIRFELLDHTKCAVCDQVDNWNGQPLNLQIDHINGDRCNNKLSNLRFICPNCHSQTEAFAGRKSRKPSNKCDCGNDITKNAKMCKKCNAHENQKNERPDKNTLLQKLKDSNFTKVAEVYGVSDNAIRKWCGIYGIPTRKRAYLDFEFED